MCYCIYENGLYLSPCAHYNNNNNYYYYYYYCPSPRCASATNAIDSDTDIFNGCLVLGNDWIISETIVK